MDTKAKIFVNRLFFNARQIHEHQELIKAANPLIAVTTYVDPSVDFDICSRLKKINGQIPFPQLEINNKVVGNISLVNEAKTDGTFLQILDSVVIDDSTNTGPACLRKLVDRHVNLIREKEYNDFIILFPTELEHFASLWEETKQLILNKGDQFARDVQSLREIFPDLLSSVLAKELATTENDISATIDNLLVDDTRQNSQPQFPAIMLLKNIKTIRILEERFDQIYLDYFTGEFLKEEAEDINHLKEENRKLKLELEYLRQFVSYK